MKADLPLYFLILTSFLFFIFTFYFIQHNKNRLTINGYILVSLVFVGCFSIFIVGSFPFSFLVLGISLLARNLVTFYMWIFICLVLNQNFIIQRKYIGFIIFKILFFFACYYNEIYLGNIPVNFQNTNPILGISNGFFSYFFIVLILVEIFKNRNNKYIREQKSKQFRMILLLLILFHVIAIFFILNYFFQYPYLFKSVTLITITLGLLVPFFSILKVEEKQFNENHYLDKENTTGRKKVEEELFEKLFQEDQIYLDSNLSMKYLSSLLNIDQNQLRFFIQKKLGYKNFSDLVNHFRMEEAVKQISHVEFTNQSNLEKIALGVGFNNYTSFYRVFMQKYKQSPSEFFKK